MGPTSMEGDHPLFKNIQVVGAGRELEPESTPSFWYLIHGATRISFYDIRDGGRTSGAVALVIGLVKVYVADTQSGEEVVTYLHLVAS